MNKTAQLFLMLLGLWAAAWGRQTSTNAAIPVAFRVDMSVQILENKFVPGTDRLSVRGSFNDFAEGVHLLTDADGDSIYATEVNLADGLAGSQIMFEYFYQHGDRGVGESIADRALVVPAGGGQVPLSYFDQDSVMTAGPLLVANSPGLQAPGAQFRVTVSVGDSAHPVSNLFGLSFELNFTNTASLDVVAGSVLAGPFLGNDLIFFSYIDEAAGNISVGMSRKAGQGGVNGHGVILEARFTSLSSTPNNTRVDYFLANVTANDANGNPVALNPGVLTVTIGQCPSVAAITPTSGAVGSSVEITGANFAGVSAVRFSNNVSAAFNLMSATQIMATVPAGAVTGPITLSKSGCPETQTGTFTVRTCPVVASLSPASAGVGEELTITGNNFTGVAAVLFSNGVAGTIKQTTATQIRVTVPIGASSGPLTLRKPDCSDVLTPAFTLLCPTVSGITPASGVAGATIAINGANLAGVTGVIFSNNAAASFTVVNAAQINAVVPPAGVSGPIQLTQAGCSDVITAAFTVLPPREVRLVSRGSTAGTVNLAIELLAQGNENALSFSVAFDPALLHTPQAGLGSGAGAAQLNVNASQVGAGRLGVFLALPAGQSFAAGTAEILTLNFGVTPLAPSATIDFGDQPVARDILDATAQPLTATWTPVTIALSAGYEADVMPRPFGSRDGTVTLEDWIQVGRFIAALDTPQTATNEFQRIDCSPRSCGNGRLSLADWVQAGRYAAGFDAVTAACGPNDSNAAKHSAEPPTAASARTVSALNDTFISGETGSLTIRLAADGNENAIAFSVNFDPGLLTFLNAGLGADATAATLHVNDRLKASGRVGIVMALPAGQTFSANGHELVTLAFAVAPNTTAVTTITFDDAVVMREAVDAAAADLPAVWAAAAITIQSPTAVKQPASEIPNSFELGQNYPNPFNPATAIAFAVPRASRVTIKVFNVLGVEVTTLVDQHFAAGRYQTVWHAGRAESGLYFYRMQAEGFVQVRKLLLIQ